VGDIPNVRSSTLSATSSIGGCSYPNVIDDLHMCIFYDELASDGVQGNLAYAYVEHMRQDDSMFPVAGVIGFDPADVDRLINRNVIELVILHEMAHLVGLGTMWPLVGVTGSVKNNCPYLGKHANAEYKRISGCDVVPTELDGRPGDGTFCSHFDEWCLQNEMMTGFLDDDSVISSISIASLHDIGYTVDYNQADASFGRSSLGKGCTCSRRRNLANTSAPVTAPGEEEANIRRTKLPSAEAQARATQYGRKILRRSNEQGSIGRLPDGAVSSAADRMVMVLVQEGDEIFSVAVHSG
jgi:Leishmanolysin